MPLRAPAITGLLILLLAGCGLPDPPDIRSQFSGKVEALGVTAVYPLEERMRLGQIWLVDASVGKANAGLTPRVPTGFLISNDLVAPMEARRKAALTSATGRFPTTSHTMDGVLGSTGNTHFVPSGDDTLELIGMPKYGLAAVDQGSLAAVVPASLARFLAALGFSRSVNLTVEAVGLEMATLPLDTITSVVHDACVGGHGTMGNRGFGNVVQTAGYNIMQNWWTQRRDDARWGAIAGFDPRLYLIAKVYYLRGLRYIYNDTTASAATFTAALNTRLAATNTPPAATAASPNPTQAVANDTNADLDARIAALTKAIGDMGDKLASNNNINVGASAARATAEGVEIVQLFERPVAFGYEPLAENIGPDKSGVLRGGIDELCRDFGAPRDQ